jgi:hypothetical protein
MRHHHAKSAFPSAFPSAFLLLSSLCCLFLASGCNQGGESAAVEGIGAIEHEPSLENEPSLEDVQQVEFDAVVLDLDAATVDSAIAAVDGEDDFRELKELANQGDAREEGNSIEEELMAEGPDRVNPTIEIPESWLRLGKEHEIWIDKKAKEVIIAGHVCLNQGGLEMFICPEHTKEHESIISAHAMAHQVHAALINLGADPGKPTSWDPKYRAAFGPTIDVTLKWQDGETKKTKTMPAKQWIRNCETKKAMEHQWVFGGSTFWEDPDTGEQIYYGDAGELICLSNFSTATIDLNVQSSQSNDGLIFEAFTENIPPIGTKVYAIIKPGKRIEGPTEAPAKKKLAEQEEQSPVETNAVPKPAGETTTDKKDDK